MNIPGVVTKIEFLDETKLGDETNGALPFEENGELQISRLIGPGKAVRNTTAPWYVKGEIGGFTIFDQTWRNDDALNGVATVRTIMICTLIIYIIVIKM